ncbi:ribonuclease 2 [Zostera marina]|uniref:Ribonuclease 2 n=1 Tax=Zostera marina TaxID=29655 RepID=A0A0K9NUX2_ZOSMR|nr:ribonuclease 2 [Zostera marina]
MTSMASSNKITGFYWTFFLMMFVIFSSSTLAISSSQREFDYYLLALEWPGTMCKSVSKCCNTNGCCDSSVPLYEFTIHGLWANYDDGTWPSCCGSTKTDFEINQVLPLMGEILKYWPSFSCSSTSLCHGKNGLFWAHEWEKHGTCMFPEIKDEYTYFSTTLDLYAKYNITKMLENAGLLASNDASYPLTEVISAIESGVGASPTVTCSSGNVEEIRICFYKNFKPRDCVLESNSAYNKLYSSSCPEYINLPSFTSIGKGRNSTVTWLAEEEATQKVIELSSI